MIYIFNEHTSFRLNVRGYEYPNSKDDWDSNWLKVSVELKDSKGLFSKVDPCLLTMELITLRDWFQAILVDSVNNEDLRFMESGLSLEYRQNEVYLLLDCDLNPDGFHADSYRLKIKSRDYEQIVKSLNALLLEFPVRNNPGQ